MFLLKSTMLNYFNFPELFPYLEEFPPPDHFLTCGNPGHQQHRFLTSNKGFLSPAWLLLVANHHCREILRLFYHQEDSLRKYIGSSDIRWSDITKIKKNPVLWETRPSIFSKQFGWRRQEALKCQQRGKFLGKVRL